MLFGGIRALSAKKAIFSSRLSLIRARLVRTHPSPPTNKVASKLQKYPTLKVNLEKTCSGMSLDARDLKLAA